MEYKDRIHELMLEAEKRGLVEESANIYAEHYRGAIVEEHILKDIMPEATVRRINVQRICEELERLLNPS